VNEILKSDDTQERCGLEMSDGTLVEIQNIADDPIGTFEMDPQAVLPLIQSGQVVATWHTHPQQDPSLSGEDYSFFLSWPDLKHKIVGVRDGQNMTLTYEVADGLVLLCE
jgi:proteasome lid subunit RPN8/RPN11